MEKITNIFRRCTLRYIIQLGDDRMANKYSKLLFDSSKIHDWINLWCELNLNGDFSVEQKSTEQRISYTIICDRKEIKIDFIKAKGGALTIFPNVGKMLKCQNYLRKIYIKELVQICQNLLLLMGSVLKCHMMILKF